jgi:hypothetical protein
MFWLLLVGATVVAGLWMGVLLSIWIESDPVGPREPYNAPKTQPTSTEAPIHLPVAFATPNA